MFYSVFLPVGAATNLTLGLVVLTFMMKVPSDLDWLEVATGAICCVIAGWLGAAAWSRYYWRRNIAQQVAVWRRIADALFAWVEDAPVPPDSVHDLKSTVEKITASQA